MAERPHVVVVHRGRFSGLKRTDRHALSERVDVTAIDVLPWARDLRLAPARAAAMVDRARLAGRPRLVAHRAMGEGGRSEGRRRGPARRRRA